MMRTSEQGQQAKLRDGASATTSASGRQIPSQGGSPANVEDVFARIRSGMNVKVPALSEMIGMSRGGLYQAIDRGEVQAIIIGRAVFVPAHEAMRLLGMKPEARAA